MPDRVQSLTVLNTIVDVDGFKRPWSMEPFARAGVGGIYLKTLTKPIFRATRRLTRLLGGEVMRRVPGGAT